MFSFVEKKQKSEDDEYIFCDDLLDEWADHITFNDKKARISFIHSKHGKKSTSASNLHDVVGQGIKNLGNMFFSQEQIWSVKFNNGSNGKFFKNYNKEKNMKRNIGKYALWVTLFLIAVVVFCLSLIWLSLACM